MTLTCLEPTAVPIPEPALGAEMASAARCGAILASAGLELTFDSEPSGEIRISAERPPGDPLRRLSFHELFALIALSPEELHTWARCPELPIPGRAEQAAAR